MNGILLDPKTGRPEARGFHIEAHTGKPDRDLISILHERGMDEIAEYLSKSRHDPFKGYTRNKHYIGGRTTATAATARNVAGAIWNPHSTSRIFLYEIWTFP